ncbi:malonate decarboxylase subunit epsilon [Vibrio jasicida]|uniref:Malonyl CoA-acyl carrier protein transacylase n=1 Tax=Vibrio jasicida TaxID=766224 RepID=A0ABW7JF03_9VIBR
MSTLFTFPGQGAQKAKMLAELPDHPAVQKVLNQVSELLGQSVYELDTEEALSLNRNVQVAMTTAACATFEWLVAEGLKPSYVLGLSIGAFPAAICSGVISFEDGLKLVDLRGRLMQEAYPQGYGMAVIIGLSTQVVKAIVDELQSQGHEVYIANINTESQTIVSGSYPALDKACEMSAKQHATKAKRLNVNVASHCALLNKQAGELWQAIKQIEFKRPKMAYASASTARVLYDVEKIRYDLAYNMAKQVKWWESAAMIDQRGVKLAIELTPGSVLTGLCKASMQDAYCVSLETTSLDNLKALYQKTLY